MSVEQHDDLRRLNVLNTPCVLTSSAELTRYLGERVKGGDEAALSVDFTNVHITAMRSMDPGFHQTTSSVDLFVPDSQVLVFATRLLGAKGNERVYGPDFLDYFTRHGDAGLKHYFLGGSQECVRKLIAKLKSIRPDLEVVGYRDGYFKPDEEDQIADEISSLAPDIVWVGLGTPKQQEWISNWCGRIQCGAMLAVGFAFDVNAGTKKDAPAWMGPVGLTWLYRLLSEPRRMWRRYAKYNSIFLAGLLLQFLGRKSHFSFLPKPTS